MVNNHAIEIETNYQLLIPSCHSLILNKDPHLEKEKFVTKHKSPCWQISSGEYFHRIGLEPDEFERELHLPDVDCVEKILPLRNIKRVTSIVPMNYKMLVRLLRLLQTADGGCPFTNAEFNIINIDPRQLKVGQRYIYRENYQDLLEEVVDIFADFPGIDGGLGDLGPSFLFGWSEEPISKEEIYSLACYLPPIIEYHVGESLRVDYMIMDGIHRNFIAKQSGKNQNVILVSGVSLPFPCSAHNWSEIKVIPLIEKPKDPHDRYFDLREGLFRNLKYLGIDG